MKQLCARPKLSFQTFSLELTAHIICSPSCHGCPEQTALKFVKLHTSIWSYNKNVIGAMLIVIKLGYNEVRLCEIKIYTWSKFCCGKRCESLSLQKQPLSYTKQCANIDSSANCVGSENTEPSMLMGACRSVECHKKNSHIIIVPILLYLVSR
jgi:hypothetical protein